MANATTIDLPLLDDAEIKWQSEGNANVYVNKEEQMEVAIGPNSTGGALRELPFGANTTVLFQLKINRGTNFPTGVPLLFQVLNRNYKTPLYTTIIHADGNVNGSFTASATQNYYVYITANNTTENDLTFVLDRFYVYIMVPNTTDYVALFKPDVLAYNDYYPFGSLVPNRHGSSTAYRYGFQGQEKDDKL